jgi:plasmid maintenance system antidote protein VapI
MQNPKTTIDYSRPLGAILEMIIKRTKLTEAEVAKSIGMKRQNLNREINKERTGGKASANVILRLQEYYLTNEKMYFSGTSEELFADLKAGQIRAEAANEVLLDALVELKVLLLKCDGKAERKRLIAECDAAGVRRLMRSKIG